MYEEINRRRRQRADTILDQKIDKFIDAFSAYHDDETLQAYALSELMIDWSAGEVVSPERVARETSGASPHITEWAQWFANELKEYEPYV